MLDIPAATPGTGAPRNAARGRGGAGSLDVRLAANASEIEAAQKLRYRVFFEEMSARPGLAARLLRRDADRYDGTCDHLVVVDRNLGAVVGTYRLLRGSAARRGNGFYSANEFDLGPLLRLPGEVLELGRSCIDPAYRTGGVMALLWQGLARYLFAHDIRAMFGCASLPGADAGALSDVLAYLHARHLAPPELRPRALLARRVEMRPDPQTPAPDFVRLPPLLKGYLRVGGFVGDGAVIDREFNTTDVCVVVKTSLLAERYYRHYARQAPMPELA